MSTATRNRQPQSQAGVTRPPLSGNKLIMLVAKREVVTRLKDRTYLISLGVFVLMIGIIVGFNVLMNSSQGKYQVAVVESEQTAAFSDAVAQQAQALDITVDLVPVADRAAAEKMVAEGDADLALVDGTLINHDPVSGPLSAAMQGAHQATQIQVQAAQSGIDPAELQKILTVEPLATQTLNDDTTNRIERGIIALVAIGFAYFMMMMIVQFVAQGVVEEKSSRVVELLLTALKARQLLAGKVIGLGLLGLSQLILIMGIGVAAALATDLITIPASAVGTILEVLAWFLLGYAFIATMTAAAASLVSRQEDLGSAMIPMTFIPLLSFFGAFKVLDDPNGPLGVLLSMLPGLSPSTMPVRNAIADVPLYQYLIAIVLQVVAIYLLVRLAARIYTGAMLKTSGKLKAREALARSKDDAEIG